MATKRRMVSLDVVDTDAFLDMPISTQNLYFHLSVRADDDGFISNPKKITRYIGGNDDDMKILLVKKFLISFEEGICVIKHWRMNNFIAKDRYTETKYLNLKRTLFIRKNGAYTLNADGEAIAVPDGHFTLEKLSVNDPLTLGQPSIGKVSKVKESREEKTPPPLYKSKKYLSAIPDEDMSTFLNRLDVGEKQIKSKAESFLLYCESKGKKYANYKSALLNAMKKDFVERTEENKRKPVRRVKMDADGKPMMGPNGIIMETV